MPRLSANRSSQPAWLLPFRHYCRLPVERATARTAGFMPACGFRSRVRPPAFCRAVHLVCHSQYADDSDRRHDDFRSARRDFCLCRDAHRHPCKGIFQLRLRVADDDPAAGDGIGLGADVGAGQSIAENARHRAAAWQSATAIFTGWYRAAFRVSSTHLWCFWR